MKYRFGGFNYGEDGKIIKIDAYIYESESGARYVHFWEDGHYKVDNNTIQCNEHYNIIDLDYEI